MKNPNHRTNRSNLFGNTQPRSHSMSQGEELLLDEQEDLMDRKTAELAGNVKKMKKTAQVLKDGLDSEKSLLDQMGIDMGRTNQTVMRTRGKLTQMMQSNNCKEICIWSIVIVVLFFVILTIMKIIKWMMAKKSDE